MANSFFSFKSFTVHQDKAAMKVCTDACLFGAWTALHTLKPDTQHILDIGTGTGLLSLMLAQFTRAKIDAVDIDKSAAIQAEENFNKCPWKEQLFVHHQSLEDFTGGQQKKFDLIICNPPFFENQLKSIQNDRNLAMHSQQFSLNLLAGSMADVLSDNGIGSVLLPYQRSSEWLTIAQKNQLTVFRSCSVKQTQDHPFFRSMFLLHKSAMMSKTGLTEKREEISIKMGPDYSPEFKTILKPYYQAF
ncbi:MAG: hypothetical protein RI983_1497 [Bacteroidota bacterium]|jgi:tRNA1Val (adenine37-N6)-methyltransferase